MIGISPLDATATGGAAFALVEVTLVRVNLLAAPMHSVHTR